MTDWADLYKDLIAKKAKAYRLDPILVMAIVKKECWGGPWAPRFEPHQYAEYLKSGKRLITPGGYASHLGISKATEEVLQCMSFGLMQVMGWVARGDHKYNDHLTKLCDPEIGLDYGCRHLRSLFNRFGSEEMDIVSAYNQGSPRKTNGLYDNQKLYVDVVAGYLREYRRLE